MELYKKKIIAAACIILIAAIIIAVLFLTGAISLKPKKYTVGKNINKDEITEFYYTVSSSVNPPEYLRYRFSNEGGRYVFFYEKREGDSFPLTEDDITDTFTSEITPDQWGSFYAAIEGGMAEARSEEAVDGDDGPFIYLYWKNDNSKFQQYSFPTKDAELQFISFCESLR